MSPQSTEDDSTLVKAIERVCCEKYTDGCGCQRCMDRKVIEGALVLLHEGMEFYADPATYRAISFISDPPCGAFMQDFTDTQEFGMKPGKYAREILWEMCCE